MSRSRCPSAQRLTGWVILTTLLAVWPLHASRQRITRTPVNDLAEGVLHDLLATPLGKALPPHRWELFLIDDYRVSASSDGLGKIFVTSGMVWFLGEVRGVWAAVLGHEIGHALILHPAYWPTFQAALDEAYRRAGSKLPGGNLLGWSAGEGRFNAVHSKERERAADYIAMILMAEAGYHPDFAITLDHWMNRSMLAVPGWAAFVSGHPRWQVREERAAKDSEAALKIFDSFWPEAAESPGGLPLPAGSIAEFTVGQAGGELLFRVVVKILKDSGANLRVTAVLVAKRWLVQTTVPEYRSSNGALNLNAYLKVSSGEAKEVSFRLPISALATHQQKFKAMVFLMASGAVIDAASRPITISVN